MNVVAGPIKTASALSISQNQQNDISKAKKVNEQAKDIPTDNEKFTELTEKRTPYLKYYQLKSKRCEAVSFGLPVHYREDGKYNEIDNSLSLVTDKDGNCANNRIMMLALGTFLLIESREHRVYAIKITFPFAIKWPELLHYSGKVIFLYNFRRAPV